MKRKLEILIGVMIIVGTVNTSFAADYIFTPKVNDEYYYSPTTVTTATIKVPITSTVSNISSPTIQFGNYESIVQDTVINYTQYTGKSEVLRDDGFIGTLRINEIDLNLKVYDGTTASSLKKGVGHFDGTSYWNGNVAIAGHNRGVNSNFGKLKKLTKGDVITYKTELGTRKYEVYFVGQIGVTDLSVLNPTNDNIITLVTCVENQPLLRLCVQAKELK